MLLELDREAALNKAPDAFRTISEVAEELDLPQHVLRFWESRFPQIKPMKRGGGRRYYRPEDIDLLRAIRDLLYEQGYTIKGVQKLMREGGLKIGDEGVVEAPADADAAEGAAVRREPVLGGDEPSIAPHVASASSGGLLRADIERLQATLRELGECKRLLDEAFDEAAPT